MLYELLGPNAYARYLLKPVLAGIVLYILLPLLLKYSLFTTFLVAGIPAGYHLLNRFFYKWFYREPHLETKVARAIYRPPLLIWLIFKFSKVAIKTFIALFVGIIGFPYLVYELVREVSAASQNK
ncbi:hypothetical protein B9G55_23825 [Saccharibacillus sp. O16]|nr:hypothetical protein B9G55_23825 [Saccharibacillus sp. O16]